MKSEKILEKICEEIAETPADNNAGSYKEEVKNLETRLKNEIDTKLGEIDKKLSMLAEATKSAGEHPADKTVEAAKDAAPLTEVSNENTEIKAE